MNLNLNREGYTPARGQVFYDQIVERTAGLPGVRGYRDRGERAARRRPRPQRLPEEADPTTTGRVLVQVNAVGLGYFQTIGIPLGEGARLHAS